MLIKKNYLFGLSIVCLSVAFFINGSVENNRSCENITRENKKISDNYISPEYFGAKGDGLTDDTVALQSALNSGYNVKCKKGATYKVFGNAYEKGGGKELPIFKLKSGIIVDLNGASIKWECQEGKIRSLFAVMDANNVVLRNGTLVGDNDNYATTYLHLFKGYSAENIVLENLTMMNAGGDSICLDDFGKSRTPCKNIRIVNCKLFNPYRNNISIICAENVTVENCRIEGACTKPPMSGIDIEPNKTNQIAKKIKISNCKFINNKSHGIALVLTNNPETVEVTVDSCTFSGSVYSLFITTRKQSISKGFFTVKNCVSENSRREAIRVKGSATKDFKVELIDLTLKDINKFRKYIPNVYSAILVENYLDSPVRDNIFLKNIKVISERKFNVCNTQNAIVQYLKE